jgi:hypothetical protein
MVSSHCLKYRSVSFEANITVSYHGVAALATGSTLTHHFLGPVSCIWRLRRGMPPEFANKLDPWNVCDAYISSKEGLQRMDDVCLAGIGRLGVHN